MPFFYQKTLLIIAALALSSGAIAGVMESELDDNMRLEPLITVVKKKAAQSSADQKAADNNGSKTAESSELMTGATKNAGPEIAVAKPASTSQGADPGVYYLRSGEDLETALHRWVKRASYNNLIWDVRDKDDDLLRLGIVADATFKCEFLDCLGKLRKAYARAKPAPLLLDIDVKTGNRIVYVRALN